MKYIEIPRSILADIIKQAREGLPNEICGLLTGRESTVLRRHPMRNVDASPDHFSFDPAEQFAVLKAARAEGEAIVANYHSHPTSPARPSEEDIRLAYDPNIVYVIASLATSEGSIRAYHIVESRVTEVPIIIV